MKNVMMILLMLGGLAISDAAAQACKPANCKPCPPGCCIVNCSTSKKGAAASASDMLTNEAQLASFMLSDKPVENEACSKMSKKELKACMAACKSLAETTDSARSVVNTSITQVASGCQPCTACKGPIACKVHRTTADATPTVHKASLQQ